MKTIDKDTLEILELTSDRLMNHYVAFQALHEILGAQVELSDDAKEGLAFICKLLANHSTATLISFDSCLQTVKGGRHE